MKPLAITGLGVVSPLGIGWEAFTAGLDDVSLDPFSESSALFEMAPYEGARVAEVRGLDAAKYVGDKGLRNTDRLTKLYLVAARLALAHAGVKSNGAWTAYGPDDVGVVAANAFGSLEAVHELNKVARLEDPRYLNPARFPNTVINSSLGYVSIWEDLRALNATVVNGPTGAVDSIGCAEMYLSSGRAKAALVGGAEALSEMLVLGMHRIGMFETREATLGEGAVLAVVEPEPAARARGARVYAVVTGYGTAFEAPDDDTELVAPSALALERAMRDAMRGASVEPGHVDLRVSGDHPVEAEALGNVFGSGAVSECPKRRVGETFGASGAFALAYALARMQRDAGVKTALIPSLGFYGNASALVLRRAE